MAELPWFYRKVYGRWTAIERLVGRLKEWRRIAIQFEKLAVNFTAMVPIAFVRLYLMR